jgi:type IV pilus assembly protein PilQ
MGVKMGKRNSRFVVSLVAISLFFGTFTAVAPAASSEPGREWLRTPITYSCINEPIETVLLALADQAKVDIVKSPRVTGSVTVKLTGVPLEEALTNILAAHDFTFIATSRMIRVVPLPEVVAVREPLDTRIYQISFADANEVAVALAGFVSEQGKIALNKGTSHLVVTDVENRIKVIDEFIRQIERPTPQILVEVQIYDITTNEGFELETNWSAGRNTPLKTTEHVNKKIDTDLPAETTVFDEHVEGFYSDADEGPGFIDTHSETSIPRETFSETDTQSWTTRRRKPFVGASFDAQTGGTLRFSLLNDAVDIELALRALSKEVESKLLANPRVLVLDNETADFEIVREIPYRELMQVERAAGITYTAFKNVGIRLKVTPHIAAGGMIKLHITPEFGILVGQNADGAPTVDTRRADTIAMIKDGQTVVIGGLRKRETIKAVSKVPVLGDMPLLGGLFKGETESVQVNEMVVFITSRIVTEPTLSDIEQRQLRTSELSTKDLSKIEAEREMTEKILKSMSNK